jgi:preprotein translocase subunit SecA
MNNFLGRALRMGEGKKLKLLEQKVAAVNDWEPEISALSDDQLAAKTDEFRERHSEGADLNDLLPEAFAVVRETAKRVLGMRHFDVQIMGGIVLFEGKIAEMKTGEGKTLVATLPVYLESLTRKGVHIVTVNDYLAKRDSEWMGQIYRFLGLKVGLLQTQVPPDERRAAYQADVTFGTNSEFGFDYLRDNMAVAAEEMVQRGHGFAIVDEVDSILIDEARTPLIISGAPEQPVDIYRSFAKIVPRLTKGEGYEVEEKTRTVAITESGVAKVEKALKIDNLYDHVNSQLVNHLNQALKAHGVFRKDVDYVVKDGEVIIVDEFTGRLMAGRRYSEGLHQAIEAKEGVRVREENQTLATITLQNYFRMYEKLAGMTGTAATEADEFRHIYKLETVVVPTHQPMVRDDMADQIYKHETAKFKAVVEDIVARHEKRQPVLVGTISIEKSEHLSGLLKRRGVKHEVLNAKHHEREAEIISQAGQPGAVTIATNMAGRGTDIVLGEGVTDVGGLHVLGTERHESRRIDNQLRGRSGRQGDPGSSQFYLSLGDDLMRMFGSEKLSGVMERLGLPDDYPIEHGLVSRSIETAQRQVEAQNFEIRKQVLKYDDVMNRQREIVYAQRREILFGDDISERSREMITDTVEHLIEVFTDAQTYPEEWDWDGLLAGAHQLLPVELNDKEIDRSSVSQQEVSDWLLNEALSFYDFRLKELGPELFGELQKTVLLQVVDNKWREHLYEMDYLKEGIGLRAIGQRDPLVEYQSEGFDMFHAMIGSIKEDFVRYIFHAQIVEERRQTAQAVAGGSPAPSPRTSTPPRQAPVSKMENVGRNDPCPCGSGKKYKKCHGA